MSEPISIPRDAPAEKGMDYALLKQEGTELIQSLSGEIWTDYNEHDPGVTTLEQLCYALTELSYRAQFPVPDLLADRDGRIDTKRQALFIPRRILPCNPTTEGDYRKLIVDRVRGVANVWLTPYRPHDPAKAVNGLYDILLYAPGIDPCACDGEDTPAAVRRRVRRVYCRHRNLCEDLHSVRLLKSLRAVVYADVSVERARTAEATLAEILFNLGNFFAPELRRVPLKSLLALGVPPDEIFNGPLLRNGFITDDQLRPKAAEIPVPEVVRVLASTRGVATVGNVAVGVGDAETFYRGNDWIPVPVNSILRLDTRAGRQRGGFTIRLFKDGAEYEPDARLVRRELDKLWAEYRRTYKLMPQYREYFPDPHGTYRDLSRYYSIQNQYPDVYGIGEYGLPSATPEARRGQAKQFKGYLLVFEQLLADFFAQLAHVKDLYSTEYKLRHTYFYQYLNDSVPNVAPLLKEDYRAGLRRIVHGQDATAARRNRFLDFLLALYAERLDASSVAGSARDDEPADDERLLDAKLSLLRHMVVSTHDRGRGFDYMTPASPRNVAGMEIKSRIQLGMSAYDHRPLLDFLDASAVEIADDDNDPASVGRPLGRHADHVEDTFVPVAVYDEALPRAGGGVEVEPPEGQTAQTPEQTGQTPEPAGPLRGRAVSEEFLLAASSPENYRAGSLPGESAVTLVCKSPSEERWRLVGKYPDLASALAAARAAVEQARELARHGRQLYIVEHTLLRFGRSSPDEQQPGAEQTTEGHHHHHHHHHGGKFPYSFTITAVVSAPPAEVVNDDYRRFVREVIRENAPALVVADYCFLGLRELRRFESLYWDWRSALRRGQPRRIVATSAALRKFLRRCRSRRAEEAV